VDHDPAQARELPQSLPRFRSAEDRALRQARRGAAPKNEGIIRSKSKIDAAIRGAQLWLEIQEKESGGFTEFIWKHVDGRPKQNVFRTLKQIPPKTKMSEGLSKELKARGFNFVGPVIVYAFAQAVGMVNDHVVSCHRHAPVAALGAKTR
jgi:DNA-3-methyladenine glycosylase I